MTAKQLFKCKERGSHYENRVTTTKCEAWCKEYKSSNLEITKLSVERSKLSSKSRFVQ